MASIASPASYYQPSSRVDENWRVDNTNPRRDLTKTFLLSESVKSARAAFGGFLLLLWIVLCLRSIIESIASIRASKRRTGRLRAQVRAEREISAALSSRRHA